MAHPEAIEASLFSRLESFPKADHKDSHLLQELANLLQELEAAKNEGYLLGVGISWHLMIRFGFSISMYQVFLCTFPCTI